MPDGNASCGNGIDHSQQVLDVRGVQNSDSLADLRLGCLDLHGTSLDCFFLVHFPGKPPNLHRGVLWSMVLV